MIKGNMNKLSDRKADIPVHISVQAIGNILSSRGGLDLERAGGAGVKCLCSSIPSPVDGTTSFNHRTCSPMHHRSCFLQH